MIHYTDGVYLHYGAPDKVFGKSDKFAEKVSYEARKDNIQLIPCPVRHMGTEYSFEVLRSMNLKKLATWKRRKGMLPPSLQHFICQIANFIQLFLIGNEKGVLRFA